MKCLLFLFTLCSVGNVFSQGSDEPVPSSSSSSQEESSQVEGNQVEGSKEEGSKEEDIKDEGSLFEDSSSEVKFYLHPDAEFPQYEDVSSTSSEDSLENQSPKTENLNEGDNNEKEVENNEKHVASNEKENKQFEEIKRLFALEMAAGDHADLIGQNEHIRQASLYKDLGRRSVAKALKNTEAGNNDYLIPEKAPAELVMLVAKESALMGSGKDVDLAEVDQKKILRSGDYWNGVWKEEVKPKSVLRTGTEKKNLGSIKAKIKQGTELYKVVSQMKEISPKLLYIINKKQV